MQRISISEDIVSASKSHKEKNDCTVIAWCNVFSCEYRKAHAYLAKFGRPPRRGMFQKELSAALKACKKAKIKFGPYSAENRVTLNQFCKLHPVGRYYVCVKGHAIAVIDGIVYDFSDKPRRQVIFACRVYLEGEDIPIKS